MPTKTKEPKGKKTKEIAEAKRQAAHATVPVTVEERVESVAEDDGGAHSIDHLTILDNEEAPDTNKEPVEDIKERTAADLSFWNNSWTWAESANSYGNKPEDSWFVNPTPKLVGEVMTNIPLIYDACEVALVAGEHTEQLSAERHRHHEFIRDAAIGDVVSECLDMLTAYQGRFFEAVQRYVGLTASYDSQRNATNPDAERLEQAKLRKVDAGAQCRTWAAKLIALYEAYHATQTDERAYNLTYDFAPLPPAEGKEPSKAYGLFRWSVNNTLNKVGRRLTRKIKDGSMDADKYRIPRPWLTKAKTENQLDADDLISDFN